MKKIKSIAFKLNLSGNGIVNYDSNDQRFFLSEHCGYNLDLKNKNINFCKKHFYNLENPIVLKVDEDGNPTKVKDLDFYVKISSQCIRHSIFEHDSSVMNPKILLTDYVNAYYATSIQSLLRGFTNLNKTGDCLVKKSCLSIGDAIDKHVRPYLDFHSNAVPKEDTSESEKKSTSLYTCENVGETNYICKGFINLDELQFMSCDQTFGRMAYSPKWIEGKYSLLEKVFNEHYGRKPYKDGYYSSATATLSTKIGEYGIKFDNEFVIFLIKEMLKRLMQINIRRANGYAYTEILSVKFITDNCLSANLDNEDDWIKIDSDFVDNLESFLDKNDYGIYDSYVELSEEEISQTLGEINKIIKEERKIEEDRKK